MTSRSLGERVKDFLTTVLVIKKGGGSKNVQNCVTSYMDDPKLIFKKNFKFINFKVNYGFSVSVT
jgi:hypothetical protein